MKTTHTPAPWIMKQKGVIRKGEKGTVIAEVTQSEGVLDITPQESEANARLIAAAPELLDALKELLRCNGLQNSEGAQAINKAVEAVIKATQP